MSRRYTEQKPDGTYEEYIVAGNGGKNKPDITVDSQLDAGSVNPVENRVVTRYASKVGDEDITGIAPTLSEAVIDINNNLPVINKTKYTELTSYETNQTFRVSKSKFYILITTPSNSNNTIYRLMANDVVCGTVVSFGGAKASSLVYLPANTDIKVEAKVNIDKVFLYE